jgi:hypothetical protein
MQESGIREQQTAISLIDSSFVSHCHASRCAIPAIETIKKPESRDRICLKVVVENRRRTWSTCEKLEGDRGDNIIVSAHLRR